MLLSLLTLVAVLAVTIAVLGYWAKIRARREVIDPPPKELLIVTPHPDDCVILAGELADQVLELGGKVHIVYVTLGGTSHDDPRHHARKLETETAWQNTSHGVVELAWLGLPQSENLAGPLAASAAEQARAREALAARFATLTHGAAIVLPAHLEEHVDHRLSRTLALEALEALARSDFLVLESDSYNHVVSFLTTPRKALFRVFGALPVVVRMVMNRTVDPGGPTGFSLLGVSGKSRLESKKARLAAYTTQNQADILVRAFGRSDRFRRIDPRRAPRGQDLTHPGFLEVSGILVDGSTLLLWSLVCAVSALVAALPVELAEQLMGRPSGRSLAIVFALIALFLATRRRSPERLAIALGLLGGAALFALT